MVSSDSSSIRSASMHALVGDPVVRRRAGLGLEAAGERPRRHQRLRGRQGLDAQVLVQVAGHPLQQRLQRVGRRHRDRRLDELCLAAVTVRRDDHPAGDRRGHAAPNSLPDDVQAGVEARRRAGRGDDRAVVEVQHVAADLRAREALLELVDVAPVGRAEPAVEQTGLAQHEGTGAHRQQAGAAGLGGAAAPRRRWPGTGSVTRSSPGMQTGRPPSSRSSPPMTSKANPGRLVVHAAGLAARRWRSRSWESPGRTGRSPRPRRARRARRGRLRRRLGRRHSSALARVWQKVGRKSRYRWHFCH